jgi:hypothetical protein
MPKYLILNSSVVKCSSISGEFIYCAESALGTIEAKSKTIAVAKAIELTGIAYPIVAIYSSLKGEELKIAEQAQSLWIQPNGNPKTMTNPRGSGRPAKHDETISVNLRLGLSIEAANWYRLQKNKSKSISLLIIEAASTKKEPPIC